MAIQFGTMLRNGATVIASREKAGETIVLAHWGRGAHYEYVTWKLDVDGNAYYGHYHSYITSAATDFDAR